MCGSSGIGKPARSYYQDSKLVNHFSRLQHAWVFFDGLPGFATWAKAAA